MYTVLIMSRKGGSGKSTTAMNMAAKFAKKYSVALMDFDPQKTLTKWHGRRCSNLGDKNSIKLINTNNDDFKKGYELLEKDNNQVLIIDTPPTIMEFHRELLEKADFTLIPVKTTMEDFETVSEVVSLIQEEDSLYGFVINETKSNTLLYLTIKEALIEDGPILGTITSTVSIPEASIRGLALCEFKDNNINCQQYEKVYSNLNRRLTNKKKGK